MTESGSQTVSRALKLLRCFSAETPKLTLTELSAMTELTVPTTHRLLRTLIHEGFLYMDDDTKRYSLGPALLKLAGAIIHRDDMHNIVLPHLERLRRQTGETAALHLLVDGMRVCIIELPSHQSIRMTSGVGRSYPLHIGAAGKVILSNLPPEELDEYVRDHLDQSWDEAAIQRLRQQLHEMRESGYAKSFGEVVDGASALASAVLDASDYPIGAINLTGPAGRWTETLMEDQLENLRDAIADIASKLGRSPVPSQDP